MAEENQGFVASAIRSQRQGFRWMEKMLTLALPESVFSPPQTAGDYTVITASEAWAGMGYGFGAGGEESEGGGGGGGGGGVSTGRPVAVIEVGPDGVRVQNIVDVTKIGLTFVSMLGGMLMMRARMRCSGRN